MTEDRKTVSQPQNGFLLRNRFSSSLLPGNPLKNVKSSISYLKIEFRHEYVNVCIYVHMLGLSQLGNIDVCMHGDIHIYIHRQTDNLI